MATCQADKTVGPSGGRLVVLRQLWVDSAALGSRAPRTTIVAISNAAAGELAWTATRLRASPWLSLSSASGTAPGTLDVTADPTGLATGAYEDTIVVTARSPGRGEARIAIRFVIHPCALGSVSPGVEVTGRLDAADCTGPHRSAMFADLYSFTGSAGDSVSVELESADFVPYIILDTATAPLPSAPPLAETGPCAYAPGAPCLRYQRLPRTGTFVIEVTTAVAGDSGAYQLRLFHPRPPSPVDSLAQLSGDSTTAIATGGVSADSTIVLRGTANDPDGGDSLRLEIEVRPVNTPFTGSPTAAGAFVPAGTRAFARVGVSDNTAYHWRARVVDQTGRASSWTDFGGNSGSATDLSVAVNDSPSAPGELGQFKGDGVAAIVVGGLADEATMVFRGSVLDPDPGDSVRLEVEIQAVGTPFTGLPTASSPLVPSGASAAVLVTGLADQTEYHWQARAVDRSGRATAWSSFGDNGETGDFHVVLAQAPAPPSGLGQFRLDGISAIAAGDTIPERSIRLRATLTDPNPGDQLRLEVEIQPVGAPFTGAASGSSVPVASGEVATALITGLAENRSYHWQARVVDQSGRAGAWTAFGDNPGATIAFHIRVPATQLVFTVQPGTTGSGAAIAPAVQVAAQDAEGNTLASFTGAVVIALSSNPAGGTLAGTLTVNAIAGIATFADLRIDRAGGAYSLVASATGPAPATSDAFGITPGSAAQLAIVTQPSDSAPSGVRFTRQPVIQLLDAAGNAVSQGGATVEAAIASGGGSLSGTTAVLTNASGVAVFTDLVLSGTVGSRTLVFEGPGLEGVTSSTVNMTAGAPSTVAVNAGNGQSAIVGTAVALPPSVIVRDASGNPVSGVAVTFAAAPGNGTLGPVAPVLTDASGVAEATSWTLGTTVGTDSVTATTSPPLMGGPVVFTATVLVGGPSQMRLENGDNQVDTVGQTLPTALAVRVADQFDNPVSNVQISWGVLDGAGAVNPFTSLTDANGIATTNWTLGTAMTPTDSVQSLQASGPSSSVTFMAFTVPGPVSPSQTSVTAFPAAISASSGSSASTVTITVRDSFGNVIKGKTAVLAATGTGNGLTQPTTTTDANGMVTGLLSATVAESKTVFVTIDGTEVTQTAAVTVIPADVSAELSTVIVAPGTVTASDGAHTASVTVTARDAFGNPIEGASVVLAVTGTGNALTQPAATTDANGVATGMLSATVAGDKGISATINGTGITETATVTIVPAGVDAAQSTVVAAPGAIEASTGASSTTITVTARDAFGNPIDSATVVLAATGTGNALTQPGLTDASGVATGSLSAMIAEPKLVSAVVNATAITQTAAVTVSPAGVSAAQSSVAVTPASLVASTGESTATITVTARDEFGNPIPEATVVLAATGTGNALLQPGTTDASGGATGTLSATMAEGKTVSVTIDGTGITQTAVVTVIPAPVSAGQSTVTAAPDLIVASGGENSATITVTARDQFGNAIEGAPVVLTATGTGNALTQPAGTTDANGVATGSLSATVAEGKIVSVTVNGTVLTQTAAMTVSPAGASPGQSTVTAAPGTITASDGASSATITVTARDEFGNAIQGAAVVLTTTGAGNALTQPGLTDASGMATGTLSATIAEPKLVSAVVNGTAITQTAALAVTPAGVSPAQSTVAAAPGTITASTGASSATLTVTARDQFGNLIEGAPVLLSATGSGNTLTQPAGSTDATGTATGVLSSTAAETKTVSATIGGTGITQTVALTVTPSIVSAGQSTVTAAPGTITASNGTSITTVTVTARDAFGNPIEGAAVVLTTTGTGNTLTQPLSLTGPGGVTIGTLSATTAEPKLVSATINATAITQTATVTVSPAAVDAAQSTVAASPATVVASTGASSATITVTARDQFGNVIEGAPVVLTATGSGNTLTQPTTTNVSGIATGSLSATAAGPKLVSATIAGTGITQTAAVTVTPAGVSAGQSTVTAAPGTITASNGASSATITVTARDEFGNAIQGAAVVLTTTGTGNTLTQPPGPTGPGGVATGILSATTAEPKLVSATINATAIAQTATVTVSAAAVDAAQSTVAATPGTITASTGASSATITVTARDQFGNAIEGVTVVLTATGTGNALTQPAGTTDASGVVTGSLSATVAEEKIVSASINGTVLTQTVATTVTPAGVSAAQSTVGAATGTLEASTGASSTAITVTARDAFGNPIEGASVVLAATGTGNTVTQPGLTDASGIATGTLSATIAEPKLVSAVVNATAITQTAAVTVTPAGVSAAQSSVAVTPASLVASTGASSATITVTARDQFGNLIQGAPVVVAATGSGNTLIQPTTTNVSGIATGSLSATAAGPKVVSATVDGTSITQTAAVTVTPAGVSPAQSSVAATPASVVASSGEGSATITVIARDQFGNPIEGVAVVLAASGSGNSLTQPGATTDANGLATGSLSATGAGDKIVSATIAGTGVTQTAAVTVTPAGVSPAQSTVAAAPGTITASNGTSSGTITVTARDEFGNAIAGATVVLAVTGTGNLLTQPAATTDASGLATGALSATVAEAKIVSATIEGTEVAQTATLAVTAGPVSATQSTVVAGPDSITAGSGVATLTVTARDQFGNPIEGATVVLSATGSGNTLTQPGTTTNASGVATGTLSATAAGDKVVSATIAGTGLTQTATTTVTAAGVSAAQSTVLAAPGAITAGSGVATITVTARDQFGNPIQGVGVVLAAGGSSTTLTQPLGLTDANGLATGTLSSTAAGDKVVSATIGGTGVTQTTTVTVTPAGVSAVQSTVVAAPETITASDGTNSATITVTARDPFGNLIQGAVVVLAATGSGNTLVQPGTTTDASGVATGTLSATLAEGKTISVTINGTAVTQTATVTVTPGGVSAGQSTVIAAPDTITASNGASSTTITVTARDAFGNPIAGANVLLAATGSGNTLTQPATTTDASGVATGSLSATGSGDNVVSATIAGTGVTQTATVTVLAASVSAVQSTVAVSPGTITAGTGVATITVTARDEFGNAIQGASVALAATGTANTLTQPGTPTDANGEATGTLSATAAESKTVSATVEGLAITQEASVVVTPAAARHLVFLVQPTSTTAGASVTPPVEVEIRDEFANRVTGATNEVTLAIATNPGGGTLTGGGPVAPAAGVASFAGLSINKVGVGYTLEASSPGLTAATSDGFTVTVGPVSAAQSTVVASLGSIPVGTEISTITVTAQDANGNPIAGATVALAVTGTAPLLTQPAGLTAADGSATGSLSATLSGTKVVSAVVNGTPIAQTASVIVQPPPGSVVFVGAGDIGDCEWTTDEATAALLDTIPGTVFTAGDNAYPDGAEIDFTNCYEPTWGRHKARTRPSPGNHDYQTPGAAPYYAYFGASAGPAGKGYYSYDLGDWHIIALNSEISMTAGAAQELWLRADLAGNTKQCTLAYWHRPLFSSGEHGNILKSKPMWRALQDYNAEVVVVGHDHNYERFAPQDTVGVADPVRGLREFVVGTGGTDLRAMNPPIPNSEVQNSDTHGVMKFTLYSTGYEWEFIPIAGKTFTDSGSGTCH